MSDRLNVEYSFDDSNASPSAFGWDFQSCAGIFLFIKFLKEIDSFVMEGRYEDIEILLNDRTKIFAQAKSIFKASNEGSKTTKLKNAIISLAKCPYNDSDILIYISNFKAPVLNDGDLFKNAVVSFVSCDRDIKEEIEREIQSISTKLSNDISKIEDDEQKNKLQELKKRIDSFNTKNLYISSIYPFFDTENPWDRKKNIKEQVSLMLHDTFHIDMLTVSAIITHLLDLWTGDVFEKSGTPVDSNNKLFKKGDFLWPIVCFIEDEMCSPKEFKKIIKCDNLSDEDLGYCVEFLHHKNHLYKSTFDFDHRVVSAFANYANLNRKDKRSDIELSFIENYYSKFAYFYEGIPTPKKEFITKYLMYVAIKNNEYVQNIKEGANL